MAFETINLGTQPAGTGGDTARSAFEKTNRNFLAADVLSAAMSQAQFEAIRAQNKERYAASGWVSFGNHESGKQVNECKPGLYTSLTTPNTLLIGKSGGVGGSKTDNASVHIDGVVFNLTNQFVLTLPSHPTSTLPERMDMYGLESEKVEISAASPNAYQGGLRGVGAAVNLFTATDQQKKDFFSANANTTYIGTDGKIYQWQLYKVSFAGTTDGVPSPSEQGYSRNTLGDLWLKAGKNLLYFGNMLRLNDGGYHPSFNPLGAAKFVGDTFWYNTTASITSRSDCFNPSKLLTGSGSIASGKSGRPEIGGRYYDAIYADGYGGVCRDMRYSAYEMTSEDYSVADLQVDKGNYRGFERAVFTKIVEESYPVSASSTAHYIYDAELFNGSAFDKTAYKKGGIFYKFYNGILYSSKIVDLYQEDLGNQLYILTEQPLPRNSGTLTICPIYEMGSVGGQFLQSAVVGNPVNIHATPLLHNGWQGVWLPQIPNGTSIEYVLPRKVIPPYSGNVINYTYTLNNGASWANSGINTNLFSIQKNSYPDEPPANIVLMLSYRAFAYQTESAANEAVYKGAAGIGAVMQIARFDHSILMESLIQKVGISASTKDLGYLAVTGYTLDTGNFIAGGGHILGGAYSASHYPIDIIVTNNSPAVKALKYNVNINQQAFIQYAYTELKHNGTNWGDDGKVTIVDNQSTKTDLNGNTVLVGTAKLKEPIGWIKNKV